MSVGDDDGSVLAEVRLQETTTRSSGSVEWSCDGRVAVATSEGVCVVSLCPSRQAVRSTLVARDWFSGDEERAEALRESVLGTGPPCEDLEVRQAWVPLTNEAARQATWSLGSLETSADGRSILAVVGAKTGKVSLWAASSRGAKCVWDQVGIVVEGAASEENDVNEEKKKSSRPLIFFNPKKTPRARCVAWRPREKDDDDLVLATGLGDGSVIVWGINSPEGPHERRRVIDGASLATALIWVNEKLVVGRADGTLEIYDSEKMIERRKPDGRSISLLASSPKENLVLCAASRLEVYRKDDAMMCLARKPGSRNATSLAFLTEEKLLLCDADGLLELWNLRSGHQEKITFPCVSPWALGTSPRRLCACILETLRYDVIKRTDPGLLLRVISLLPVLAPTTVDLPRRQHDTNDEFLWIKMQSATRKRRLLEENFVNGKGDLSLETFVSDADRLVDDLAAHKKNLSKPLLHLAHALASKPQTLDALRQEIIIRQQKTQKHKKKRPDYSQEEQEELCRICDGPMRDASMFPFAPRRLCLKGHANLVSAHSGRLLALDEQRWACPACGASITAEDDPRKLCPFCRCHCAPP